MSSKIFSQVAELNKNGDTVICFSKAQAKFLAKEHYRADTYYQSDSICKKQIKEKDLVINMYKKIEDKQQQMLLNQTNIIKLKNDEVAELEGKIKTKDKEIKMQKFYKWVSIGVGGALSGYFGFKYVTK